MEAKTISWSKIRHHWEIYLFVLPTVALIGLFIYYPALQGMFRSFYRWNGSDIAEPVGFGNYVDLVTRSEFWRSFRVAFIIGFWNIIKMIPALLVAVCIHRCRSEKMQFIYRLLFVIPMVIPSLVVVLVWRSFFFEATSGYLNRFLEQTGLFDILCWADKTFDWGGAFVAGQSPAWLGDPNLILPAAVLWGFPWVGSFAVLTYLAKLQSIDRQVYEAADIDGANWLDKFRRIELPLITGSIYIMLTFTIIGTLSDAGMVIALAGIEGGPGGALTVPAVFMMRKAFIDQQMGYACAVGIVLTLIVLMLQKLSTLITDWDKASPLVKIGVRLLCLAVGVLLVFANTLIVVALGLVVLGVPWQKIATLFKSHTPAAVTAPTTKIRFHPQAMVRATGFRRVREWCWDAFLRCCKHGFIWLVLLTAFFPVYLMCVVSFKTNQQFYAAPTTITTPAHTENWITAWQMISPTVANSIFICTVSTVLTMILGLAAAYFFARLRMPMSGFLWNALLILMMMPLIANLVPLFVLLRDMNMLNTFSALIVVGTAGGQMFAIFVLRNFVADIPQGLFDAGEIDGASHFQQFRHIVIPMSGPILGTVGVMHFINAWNEFVIALIVMRDQGQLPVTVQLLRMAGEYIKLWGPLMAGYAIASVPVVILFAFSMRLFIRGMTEGAVKG